MPFHDYMALALYSPEHGYYSSQIADVGGNRADFSTWATLGDLGRTVASWVKAEIAHHDWTSETVHLIEIGAGDGSLAYQLLKSLGWRQRRRVHYHIVDISPPLRSLQQQRLKRYSVSWHASVQQAIAAARGRAILFSNELVDAFPAQWLCWDGAGWQEVQVNYDPSSGLRETFRPSEVTIDWQPQKTGQRIERHPSYRDWLSEWLPALKAGSLLTIDYGGRDWPSIYTPKPAGTMRGYHQQRRIEGGAIYQRFGQQDLTADVNFGEIQKWGEAQGLQTIELNDLARFFEAYDAPVERVEAAEAFLVLHQRL